MSTCEHRRIEREELPQAGDHLDVLGADPAQDGGAELLVAAAEQRALAAHDADHERRRLVAEQLEQLALAEVGAEQPAGAHRVDAEQRLRQARAAA